MFSSGKRRGGRVIVATGQLDTKLIFKNDEQQSRVTNSQYPFPIADDDFFSRYPERDCSPSSRR